MTNEELPLHLRTNSNPPTSKEIELAYIFWLRHYPFEGADETVKKFSAAEEVMNEPRSQLEVARTARLHSTSAAAAKLGCAKATWGKLETSERRGSITLNSLRKAAEAIDCELIYCVRPKNQKLFSRAVFEDLLQHLKDHKSLTKCRGDWKYLALASLLGKALRDVKFRRKIGFAKKLAEPREPLLWRSAEEHEEAKQSDAAQREEH